MRYWIAAFCRGFVMGLLEGLGPAPAGSSVEVSGGKQAAGSLEASTSRQPIACSSEELATAHAQAGVGFVASVRDLVEFALKREDPVLSGQVRWLHTALMHWLQVDDHAPVEQLQADRQEVLAELMVDFRGLVALGVQRQDTELLAQLGNLQRAWVRWAESREAVALEAARSNA